MRVPYLLFLAIFFQSNQSYADSLSNQTYQNQTKIRQLEIDQRMNQIQQDMKSQSNAILGSTSSTPRTFAPSLPGYSSPPRIPTSNRVSEDQIKAYLEGLGDPEAGTGIYAYPPEERLYRYGLMCIEVGFVNEGVRAITDHLRISSEMDQ